MACTLRSAVSAVPVGLISLISTVVEVMFSTTANEVPLVPVVYSTVALAKKFPLLLRAVLQLNVPSNKLPFAGTLVVVAALQVVHGPEVVPQALVHHGAVGLIVVEALSML